MSARDNYYDYNPQAQTYDPYSNQYQQPQYPPQQPYPQQPPYPPQQYLGYPPPQKKSNVVVIVVIILIILFMVIPIIAGVMYVWISGFETEESGWGGGGSGSVKITSLKTEKETAYLITITSVYDGTLNLGEAEFQITDENNVLQYKLTISDANPAAYASGQSKIYALTHTTVGVTNSNGDVVDGYDSLRDYTNCTIAYIDQNDDEKVSADDSIWIYMDNNDAGTENVTNKYTFKIVDGYDETVHSKQL